MKATHVLTWASALALAAALPSQEVTSVVPNEEVLAIYSGTSEPTGSKVVPVEWSVRLGEEVYGVLTPPPAPPPPASCPPFGSYSFVPGEVLRVSPPAAVWPDPVPTRINGEYYGHWLNWGTPIEIECYIHGAASNESAIRVKGGEPFAGSVLFCSPEAQIHPTPWGAFLGVPACVAIPGVFNADGVFDVPIDLGRQALCDTTFYLQGLEWKGGDAIALSWGLALRYAPGNEQPPLGHHLPAMEAILCKTSIEAKALAHEVLLTFEAAESYELVVKHVVFGKEKVWVYASLESPGGPSGAMGWHRAVVHVGNKLVKPEIEVWVAVDHGYPLSPTYVTPTYKLGALIETEF